MIIWLRSKKSSISIEKRFVQTPQSPAVKGTDFMKAAGLLKGWDSYEGYRLQRRVRALARTFSRLKSTGLSPLKIAFYHHLMTANHPTSFQELRS